jgi:hypothetical protein
MRIRSLGSICLGSRPNKCQKRPTIGAKETYYMRTFESLGSTSTLAIEILLGPRILLADWHFTYVCMCVRVRVCVCARARVFVCVCVCVSE